MPTFAITLRITCTLIVLEIPEHEEEEEEEEDLTRIARRATMIFVMANNRRKR